MNWRCGKIHGLYKACLRFKRSVCHGKVRELLSFLGKSRKTFLQFDLKKNFVKHIENLPQYLSEKFIRDNLSITDIAEDVEIYRLSVSARVF